MSRRSRARAARRELRLKAKKSAGPPAPSAPAAAQRPSRGLSALWRSAGGELRTKPLASAGAIAAIVVIAPLIISAVDDLGKKPLVLQRAPVDLRTGQYTSPDVVVPGALSTGDRPPPDEKEFRDWARAHDAVYANKMAISFLARSDADEPTLVTAARVKVLERRSPLTGTHVVPTGAGPGPNRLMYSDLDEDPPTVRIGSGWSFPLQVARTDIEAFTVEPSTDDCYCSFVIELDYVDPDGDKQTAVMDDDGKPFELTSSSAAQRKVKIVYG